MSAQSNPDQRKSEVPTPKKVGLIEQRRSIVKAAISQADDPLTLPDLVKASGLHLSAVAMAVRQLELDGEAVYAEGEGYSSTAKAARSDEVIRQSSKAPKPSTPQTPAEFKAWRAEQRRR